jgi:cyclophilin family peptidyl-prolyl cis-trans isomerase/TolB-like protein
MLLALLLAASQSPLVAVLEFNSTLKGAEREDLDRAYFSDRVRRAALKALPGVRLMTRENMQVLAQSRGVDLEKCEGLCEVEIGRQLDADYVISGDLRRLAGAYRLTLKLYDVRGAQLLASEEATGEKGRALLADTDRATAELVAPLRKSEVRQEQEGPKPNQPQAVIQGVLPKRNQKHTVIGGGADPGKTGRFRAVIETSMGTIHCDLFDKQAPKTVDNFVTLARKKFYDGLTFHRVIPGFMIQGGDPTGNGTGGPGYKFDDEIVPGLTFDRPGVLAMANAGPNTNGSQFFITDKEDLRWLDGHYSIFGQCTDIDVIHAIAGVPRGAMDRPNTPVRIEKIAIE